LTIEGVHSIIEHMTVIDLKEHTRLRKVRELSEFIDSKIRISQELGAEIQLLLLEYYAIQLQLTPFEKAELKPKQMEFDFVYKR